jgi:hypothetical protein
VYPFVLDTEAHNECFPASRRLWRLSAPSPVVVGPWRHDGSRSLSGGGSRFDVFIGLFRACILLRKVWWWRLSRDGMTVLLAHCWRSCGGLAWTDLIAFGMCSLWSTFLFIDAGCCSLAPVLWTLARRLFICPLQQGLIQQVLPVSNEGGARTATRVWLVLVCSHC